MIPGTSVPFEYISCIHFVLYIVQFRIVAVCDDGVSLGLEDSQVIHDAGSEEGNAILKGRLVHDDLGALRLDALHDALDGGLAEIVGACLHRKPVYTHDDLLLLRRIESAGGGVIACLFQHAVRNIVFAGAVGVHNGLD